MYLDVGYMFLNGMWMWDIMYLDILYLDVDEFTRVPTGPDLHTLLTAGEEMAMALVATKDLTVSMTCFILSPEDFSYPLVN